MQAQVQAEDNIHDGFWEEHEKIGVYGSVISGPAA